MRKLSSKGGGIRDRKENQIYTGHKPSVKLFFSRSIKGSEKDPCRVELHEVKTEEGERKEKKGKNGECVYINVAFQISAHTSSLKLTVCYFMFLSKRNS